MKPPFYSSKAFVNLPGCNSDASIFSQIVFYSDDSSGYDATLKLRDCGNSIHFAVGLNDEGDRSYENSLFKVEALIKELVAFRDALVQAKSIYDERAKVEELERQQYMSKNENHEMDPRHSHPPDISSVNYSTDNSVRGLEDLQAAVNVVPNL